MIRCIDFLIGLRLFHPLIIWVCQRARITQWALYRYGWWIYALWALWRDNHSSAGQTIWLVVFALIRTLNAGLSQNSPAPQSLILRVALWAFGAMILLPPVAPADLAAAGMLLFVLAAEYATTIRTIPPRKKREQAIRKREAWTRGAERTSRDPPPLAQVPAARSAVCGRLLRARCCWLIRSPQQAFEVWTPRES